MHVDRSVSIATHWLLTGDPMSWKWVVVYLVAVQLYLASTGAVLAQAQNPPAFFVINGNIANGDQSDPGFPYYADSASGSFSKSRDVHYGTMSVSASIGVSSISATFQGSMDPVHASR